jgi:hypothetical protein
MSGIWHVPPQVRGRKLFAMTAHGDAAELLQLVAELVEAGLLEVSYGLVLVMAEDVRPPSSPSEPLVYPRPLLNVCFVLCDETVNIHLGDVAGGRARA